MTAPRDAARGSAHVPGDRPAEPPNGAARVPDPRGSGAGAADDDVPRASAPARTSRTGRTPALLGSVTTRVPRPIARTGLRWLVFAAAVVVWQFAVRLVPEHKKLFFPPPSVIVRRMYEMWFSGPVERGFLTNAAIDHIMPSLQRLFAGWVLAVLVGITVGVLIGRCRLVHDYVDPLIHFFRALPPPALIPVFMMIFKLSDTMRVAVIAFGVIWPVILNAAEGARSVQPLQLDTSRVYKLTAVDRLRKVILPAAGPKIFAGLRISLSLALILMVVSEMIGGTEGIGFGLFNAKEGFEMPEMWAFIVLIGILGYSLNEALLWLERRALSWHYASRRVG